ncbi:MAG: hypothetical protein EU549_03730 [Promethearchaeota archaeon]|nr:MAG: hypothetical protein EU549_03730 [Candidatus Lokiarchaeota archaeon]
MRRFASIDFLRGLAIWLMILVHTVMRWYDRTWIEAGGVEVPGILLVLMILLIVIGGSAGFFLMVSAIGNMISMWRNLEKGISIKGLFLKQVLGGLLLLVFAMLVEAIIGYKGALGQLVISEWEYGVWAYRYRFFHMETIHTIAFCIIINGIVQVILSRNNGFKKIKRNVIIYAILAVICVILTIPIYNIVRYFIPGYPLGLNPETGIPVQYPLIGISGLGDFLASFFLFPIAGNPEPLFPFLAISFIGSIIGILMCKEKPSKSFPKKGMYIGFAMFIIGAVGVVTAIATGFETFGNFLANFWNITGLYPNSWFWWFICVNGIAIILILLIIRCVEFRGIGADFAKKTIYFRRIGFVAFSIYSFQFLDCLPRFLYGLIPGIPTYPTMMGPQVILLIPLVFLTWELILRLWEKVNFTGGLEWSIGVIADRLIPAKGAKGPWWKPSRLDAKEYLYKAEWLNIIPKSEVEHEKLKDSKLAFKLSLLGFIGFPLSIIALFISRTSKKTEGKNKYNRAAMILSIIGLAFLAILLVVLSFITVML